MAEPLVMRHAGAGPRSSTPTIFTEEVRRELVERLRRGGLLRGRPVGPHHAVDPPLQAIAELALRGGLCELRPPPRLARPGEPDRRARRLAGAGWPSSAGVDGLDSWRLAMVLEHRRAGDLGLADGARAACRSPRWPGRGARRERPARSERRRRSAGAGDVLSSRRATSSWSSGADGRRNGNASRRATRCARCPRSSGAMVAIDPHTGRVLAMSGGFSYAPEPVQPGHPGAAPAGLGVQAVRLSGGAGERLSRRPAMVLDAPIVIDQGPGLPASGSPRTTPSEFSGPEHAAPRAREVAQPDDRAAGPGRSAWTRWSTMVEPVRHRSTSMRRQSRRRRSAPARPRCSADHRLCDAGQWRQADQADADRAHPGPPRQAPSSARDDRATATAATRRLARPAAAGPARQARAGHRPGTAYQMVIMLQGVVQRGTGRRAQRARQAARRQDRHHQRPRRLVHRLHARPRGRRLSSASTSRAAGRRARPGATAALPIFIEFMQKALADKPATPFRVPPGIRLVRVDAETGQRPARTRRGVVLEAFMPGTEPPRSAAAVLGVGATAAASAADADRAARPAPAPSGSAPAGLCCTRSGP